MQLLTLVHRPVPFEDLEAWVYAEAALAGCHCSIAVMNQKRPERTEWKESAICTKSWNNSVLQFGKVSDMCDPEAGFLHKCALCF